MPRKLLLLGTLALVVSCSSSAKTSGGSTTGSSTTAAIADSSSTTAVSSSGASATTSPATTGLAPTSTVAPEPLILREDGLGPFDFGPSTATEVIEAVTAQLGPPARNDAVRYENESHLSEGYYESLDPPNYFAFNFPFGQTVCWTGDFCAEFGGYSAANVAFVGWQYSGPAHMLASASNLTIGAEWEDFPSMVVYPTCYNTGGGTHHDIVMVLAVVGGWEWLVSDGAGGYVPNLPDPAITKVTFLSAGVYPFQAGLDC